ncbi:hypothetical protein [uncultured Abiotrophia sp.]|uniref:hypothetical protein n=1 Tax=uncultured Abiotrophia sp. TaxID=316094 RepID=UPI0028899D17|nr:hypothetical protein [uncultured Abiotrophia sp.]
MSIELQQIEEKKAIERQIIEGIIAPGCIGKMQALLQQATLNTKQSYANMSREISDVKNELGVYIVGEFGESVSQKLEEQALNLLNKP